MAQDGKTRFIRRGGKVIPISGKGSAPNGTSKRYGAKRQTPKPKQLGKKSKAAVTAAGAFAGGAYGIKSGRSLVGGLVGATLGGAFAGMAAGTKIYKKGKGESKKQLAKRASTGF